jgi:hypothetical protein
MRNREQLMFVSLSTVVFVLFTGLNAWSQGIFRADLTDEWDNPIVGAAVTMTADATGIVQETTTDDDGGFQFMQLAAGEWELQIDADGYGGILSGVTIRRLSENRSLNIELVAFPPGGLFRDGLVFEAEGGTPSIEFDGDGEFEFEDAEGEGEGTYGLVDLSAVLTVRDYDGPDDKYSITQPVIVTFPSDQFMSLTWDGQVLTQQDAN